MSMRNAGIFPLMMTAILLGWIVHPAMAQEPDDSRMAAMLHPDNPFPPITRERDSLQPYVAHPEQAKEAANKLAALEKRFGKKPNIIVLLVDDMGWGDPGCFGGGEAVGAPTPQIDRMAAEGLRLTSTYSQHTCTPTRATMLSGRLNIRHGIYRPPMYGERGGIGEEVTAASLLQKAGYTTAAVGKWHLGETKENQPQNNGFDEFFGFLGVANIYTEWRDPYFNPEIANNPFFQAAIEKFPFSKHLVKGKKGGELENVKLLDIPGLANCDMDFKNYSVDFIKRQADSKKPFFLWHCFSKVHFDNYPAEGYAGRSPSKYPYKDGMVEVDDIVGEILQTLRDTSLAENTFVLFTSDNGVEEDTWPDAGYAPWRGSKGTSWEGGVRVPGIVWMPGTVRAGRASDGLFDLADFFNTSLALAGRKDLIPKDRYIDGIDQTSFFLADKGLSNRAVVYYWSDGRFHAIRWREYKIYSHIVNIGNGSYGAMGGMNQGTVETADKAFAFNLYVDPRERRPMVIRKTWLAPIMMKVRAEHMATFQEYPAKKPIVDLR